MTRHIAELETEEPGLVLSGLVGRILAIQYGDKVLGQAHSFHLKSVKPTDGRDPYIRLACRIDIDQEEFSEIAERVQSGEIKLIIDNNIALGAISRPSS